MGHERRFRYAPAGCKPLRMGDCRSRALVGPPSQLMSYCKRASVASPESTKRIGMRPRSRWFDGARRRKSNRPENFGLRYVETHVLKNKTPTTRRKFASRRCRIRSTSYRDQHRRNAGCAANQASGSSVAAVGVELPDNWANRSRA